MTGPLLQCTEKSCSSYTGHHPNCEEGKKEVLAVTGSDFVVKDSGKRQEFSSGMVRDTTEGKPDWTRLLSGPMLKRWQAHLDKGAVKYPDVGPGVANWTLASGLEELQRFRASALRHMMQWLNGEVDEDHAAAVYFNINGAEAVKEKMDEHDVFVFPVPFLVERIRIDEGANPKVCSHEIEDPGESACS